MASPRPPQGKPLDLEITVVSAKHLKNVNWHHGDLKPYAVAYLDPDRRAATKPDDAGNTRPVWNERLSLPLPPSLLDPPLFLTFDIFHSKPSETPKPLVGTARCSVKDLLGPDAFAAAASSGVALDGSPVPIKTLELRRPSGRPQGKIRIKVAIRERPCPPPGPAYQFAPPSGYYYSTAPPPSARDYRAYSPPPPPVPPYSHPMPSQPSPYPYGNYSDPYSGYYSSTAGYYSAPPAPAPAPAPARPYYDRASVYGGPSAPVDYSSGPSSYEQKTKGARLGMGTGLAVGAVAGALGGLALDEGLKYEEKIAERVESDLAARDDYSDYRADY
ncbi:extensin [Phoenix dactylifera]|uniref:Extensin n=1 Tax=Phoenix dactylifera TaxID=42345 RepID=A0A8B7BTZ5_PHODC|nr:extensin [Phoenix dactylifera]